VQAIGAWAGLDQTEKFKNSWPGERPGSCLSVRWEWVLKIR